MKHRKIVFVCTGNTCRSPMAQAIMTDIIKNNHQKWWSVQSYGLNVPYESPLSDHAELVLKEKSLALPEFRSKQLTSKIIQSATLIVCMTDRQKLQIKAKNVVSAKDVLGYDIADPYGCDLSFYRKTRDDIQHLCQLIYDYFIIKFTEESI